MENNLNSLSYKYFYIAVKLATFSFFFLECNWKMSLKDFNERLYFITIKTTVCYLSEDC